MFFMRRIKILKSGSAYGFWSCQTFYRGIENSSRTPGFAVGGRTVLGDSHLCSLSLRMLERAWLIVPMYPRSCLSVNSCEESQPVTEAVWIGHLDGVCSGTALAIRTSVKRIN